MKEITTEDVKAWKAEVDKQGPGRTNFSEPEGNGYRIVGGVWLGKDQYEMFMEEFIKQGKMKDEELSGVQLPRQFNYEELREEIARFTFMNYHVPTHLIVQRNQFYKWAKDAFTGSFKFNGLTLDDKLTVDGVTLTIIFADNVAEGEYFLTWAGKQ